MRERYAQLAGFRRRIFLREAASEVGVPPHEMGESESEPTALPFFPYNQLQLGFSLLLLLPPVFSGEAVVGARAYCRR